MSSQPLTSEIAPSKITRSSTKKSGIICEYTEVSELFLEKFIALNPLYYIDDNEDEFIGCGFSSGSNAHSPRKVF